MKPFMSAALAGASLLALAQTANAQTAPVQTAPAAPAPAAAAAPDEAISLGEVVVTARRRSESLQTVPQTVNAVTSDTLQKLNITQFQDVQNVVPGMSLTNRSDGYSQAASMRGVTFDVNTAAPLGTVAMYVNDAPVQSSFAFNALYDVGQIEVLRGPQGTTRGVSAPSGAMTITTHKPDLSGFGGYVNGTLTDLQGRNAQGAINIPIIQDVLAVRIAGLIDENIGDGTRSIHSSQRPNNTTTSERIGVSFEPSDIFNANITYQHTDKRVHAFDPVSGPGHVFPATGAVQYVDPALSPFDRAAVEDGISDSRIHSDLVTTQIDSRFAGQHVSYVGSYSRNLVYAPQNMGTTSVADVGDILPGIELFNKQRVGTETTTHEIRLASDPAPGRFIDYTVGGYYSWTHNFGPAIQPPLPAQGAFGTPFGPPDLAAYDPRYTLGYSIADTEATAQETSLFASVTLHLGDKTELSGGIRHIWSIYNSKQSLDLGNQFLAVPASALGGACSPATPASAFPGFCNVGPLGSNLVGAPFRVSDTPNIYQVSLSHHFTRDLMVYVNTGTSFRPAFSSAGITSEDILSSTDPLVQGLVNHPSERSRSYELGVKSTFLDGRARINADIYRQRFSNFTMNIPHIQVNGGAPFAFTAPVDALVQGIEVDAALQITREWNVGLQYSYADGSVEGTLVPCNTFDAAGNPTYNRGVISVCPGGSASRQPYWNATLTSEYAHPVRDGMDGFIRGLFSYYPENKDRMEPDFTVPSYGLLNLYAGVRSQDGAWEVSVFAKNALYNKTVLDRSPVDSNLNSYLGVPASSFGYGSYLGTFFPAYSGYYSTQVTPEREVGVNVRYAWGTR